MTLKLQHIEDLGAETISLGVAERGALFLASAFLAVLPFFVVTFPPITDLPQHLAQIRLLGETLADPGGPYRIQWWTPYGLPYALLALCSAIAPPLLAGRLAFAVIALLWVATAHGLALHRGRSPLAAVLASLFVFCNVVYWGFLSFALGWPVFAAWMLATTRQVPRRRHQVVLVAALGLVLYACHALWLLAGIAWVGVVTAAAVIRDWRSDASLRAILRPLVWRAWALAPAAVALALWTPGFQASGARSPALWTMSPIERLNPRWLIDAALGGLRGPIEWLLAGFVLTWVAIGVVQYRGRLRTAVDGHLLLGAALLGAFALTLPDKYMHTIQLAERWMPFAAMLLILAAPVPRLHPALTRLAVVGVAGLFVAATSLKWIGFERRELSGLVDAVDRLPPNPRVLGLDYQQRSAFVRGRPFLQTYAWAQVVKGGTPNFSFASFPTSLVVFRSQLPTPWTPQLYWFPRRLRATDLDHFDYVIINGAPGEHRAVTMAWGFQPLTTTGSWRLYRIDHGVAGITAAVAEASYRAGREEGWGGRWDSNPRQPESQSGALTN